MVPFVRCCSTEKPEKAIDEINQQVMNSTEKKYNK